MAVRVLGGKVPRFLCRRGGVIQTYDDTHGLAHLCGALLVDRGGHVWIGTSQGVSRFDGRGFSNYTVADGMSHGRSLCILQARTGDIWIGTSRGLCRYKDRTFEDVSARDGLSLTAGVVCLAEDDRGNLWIGRETGITRYDGKSHISWIADEGLAPGVVNSIIQDGDGSMLIGTDGGLSRFDGKTFSVPAGTGELTGRRVMSLCRDRSGYLWIGTWGSGAIRYDGKTLEVFDRKQGLGNSRVWRVFQSSDSTVWIGTQGGGVSLLRDGCLETIKTDDGLAHNVVTDIAEDAEGNMWFACTHGGISRYHPREMKMIADTHVDKAMIRDRRGRLWWGGGGALWCHDGTELRRFPLELDILAMLEDKQGRFWLATSEGLYRYNSTDAVGTEDPMRVPKESGLVEKAIWSLLQDSKGTMWAGTQRGLYRCGEDGNFVRLTGDCSPEYVVSTLCEDRDGCLWIGGWNRGNLIKYDGRSCVEVRAEAAMPEHVVISVMQDRAGRLWLGTSDGLFVREGNAFRRFGEPGGLAPVMAETIIEDRRGVIWMGTLGGGIWRFDGKNLQQLTRRDGLPSNSVCSLIESGEGEMLLATYRGVCRYLSCVDTKPVAHIAWVEDEKKHYSPRELKIPESSSSIRIGYYAVSHRTARMRYRRILEGHDRDWTATWEETAVYENLPPGEYVFKVEGINKDLVVSPECASVRISVFSDPKDQMMVRLKSEVRDRTESLNAARQYLSNIIETMTDALFIIMPDGTITKVNNSACRLLGYAEEALIGRSIHGLVQNREFHKDGKILGRFPDGVLQNIDISLLAADGSAIPVLFSSSAMKDATSKTESIVCVAKDITELKHKDGELIEKNMVLSKALSNLKRVQEELVKHERLRALGEMSTGIAHDFNNALMPIVGYADMLLNHPEMLDDRKGTLDMLMEMSISAKGAATAVRRLREFFRPVSESDRESVNLRTIAETSIAMTRPKWREEKAAQGVIIEVVPEVEDVPAVSANGFELRTVMGNLIFNAVDAMPGGGKITVRCYRKGNNVVVQVADNGTGMAPDVLRRCLEPFFTTKGAHGSGLGLSMAYGVVRRYGGNIDLASSEGEGTTVTLRFPVESKPAVAAVPSASAAQADVGRLNILVIDDEASARSFITKVLRSQGYVVESAETGAGGILKFQDRKFDLVITDRAMPDMSGDKVAMTVKSKTPGCPVIMLTGFGNIMKEEGESPVSVDLVLGKPTDMTELINAVKSCVLASRKSSA